MARRRPIPLRLALGAVTALVAVGCGAVPSAPAGVRLRDVPAGSVTDVRVTGAAMEPTLADGDVVAVDGQAYRDRMPVRGDLVLVRIPDEPSRTVVKRLLAVPGDIVEITGAPAILVMPAGQAPWQRVVEPYLASGSWRHATPCCDAAGRATDAATPLTVPPGTYLVLGDDRDTSRDSRTFGLVPADDVLGEVVARVGPAGRPDLDLRRPGLVAA